MRTALLAAVGHDLRTPLASAKAAVTSLRSTDVEWSAQDRAELLLTADESLDRLTRLVDNLLDMSRLNAGAMSVLAGRWRSTRSCRWRWTTSAVAQRGRWSTCRTTCREVHADPGLLERVVANLVANAVRYIASGGPPCVTGSSLGDRVELRVVDRGPGIPPPTWTGCSRRSSDSATPTTPPVSGSGWPCPAA